MNKKLILLGLPILAIALVAAAYVVHTFTINVDVGEPFDIVEYAILGDASSYNPLVHGYCSNVSSWTTYSDEVDMGYIDAGESRKFCVRIVNNADASIDYTIKGEVLTGYGNYNDCFAAFGSPTKTGTALPGENIDGEEIVVAQDAKPVDDCKIAISVARG